MASKNDIKGKESILMTTGESKRTYQLEYTVKTANSDKAGYLPAGGNVASVTGKVLDSDDAEVANVFDSSPSVLSNIVTMVLNEPSTGTGHYTVVLTATLDSGAVRIRKIPMEVEE